MNGIELNQVQRRRGRCRAVPSPDALAQGRATGRADGGRYVRIEEINVERDVQQAVGGRNFARNCARARECRLIDGASAISTFVFARAACSSVGSTMRRPIMQMFSVGTDWSRLESHQTPVWLR
jgi:hypothetical protein